MNKNKENTVAEETEAVSEETGAATTAIKGISIETESGFKCTVKENALGDMRVFDALVKVESRKTDGMTKALKLIEILDALLGEEQKEDLYDFLAERDGQARSPEVMKILREIISKINESKKK